MKTFRRKGKPVRKSFEVLAAPGFFEIALKATPQEIEKAGAAERKEELKKSSDPQTVRVSRFADLPVEHFEKIGESTFSEVFMNKETETVFKVLPLTAHKEYKKVQHTKIDHFLKEVLVMEKMNRSESSVRIHRWWVVEDVYPKGLVDKCRKWAKSNQEIAENAIPLKNNSSGVFGVIEMEHGGRELAALEKEGVDKETAEQIIEGIKKCVASLNEMEVEHRDMHESNVLLKKEKDGRVAVKAIDYSLSRASWSGEGAGSVAVRLFTKDTLTFETGRVLYTDIDKEVPWLFSGTDGQPHREVYKKMDLCYAGTDRWRKKGDSNYFWLIYLTDWVKKITTEKKTPASEKDLE